MTTQGYKGVTPMLPNEKEHRRQMAEAINSQLAGKLNAVNQLTLTPGATSTTFIDSRIGANTFIGFSPLTQNAVTAQISGLHVASQKNGEATIAHASAPATDQTFNVLLIG
jgi:hypothetical protein